ncbi:MAG: single-stranded DNA-binding protein [Magnetococcales bacterium]|nr:single-stranded DNA-binding protein [Magnetococcales bacterium]
MSYSLNKVQLIGNLGAEPEIRYTQAGKPMATLNVATSERWRDQQGNQQERTEWHRVVIFDKQAEIVQQYMHKGSKVYIEGQLRTRKWQDQAGQDRYTTEVVLGGFNSQIILLDARGGAAAPGMTPDGYAPSARPASPPSPSPAPANTAGGGSSGYPPFPPPEAPYLNEDFNQAPAFRDDIPF